VALSGLMTHETNDDRFERGLDIIVRGLASYLKD
jgi:TetR/AcrR family transcriptional regulator, tetracycline repressor protein